MTHTLQKMGWATVLALGIAAGLGGCNSAPIRFHTLVPPPTDGGREGERIVVENVSVPPQVNRTELVIREDASRLVILESHWWGASLPEEIQSALTAHLDGETSPEPVRVWVTVSRFDAIPGQAAWLDADYRLALYPDSGGETRRLNCRFRARAQAGGDITSLVLAHQENIDALARRIADTASRFKQGQTTCP